MAPRRTDLPHQPGEADAEARAPPTILFLAKDGDDMSGSDLFTGTLDLLILRTLAAEPLHGYGIGKVIRRTSEGVLDVEEGALYPALHRLDRRGLVSSEWGRTGTGRRAKFYRLTDDGVEELERESQRWAEYSHAVQAVLSGTEAGRG